MKTDERPDARTLRQTIKVLLLILPFVGSLIGAAFTLYWIELKTQYPEFTVTQLLAQSSVVVLCILISLMFTLRHYFRRLDSVLR